MIPSGSVRVPWHSSPRFQHISQLLTIERFVWHMKCPVGVHRNALLAETYVYTVCDENIQYFTYHSNSRKSFTALGIAVRFIAVSCNHESITVNNYIYCLPRDSLLLFTTDSVRITYICIISVRITSDCCLTTEHRDHANVRILMAEK